MKTKEELLKFYGVEIGKKYKIYNHVHDWNAMFDGETFEVRVHAHGDVFIKFDSDDNYESIFVEPKFKLNFLDDLYYYDAEVLDEAEKEYLSNVIRPFKNRVIYVIKHKTSGEESEYISIGLKSNIINSGEDFYLPYFKSGTMYKGMTLNKRYTLAELGLL